MDIMTWGQFRSDIYAQNRIIINSQTQISQQLKQRTKITFNKIQANLFKTLCDIKINLNGKSCQIEDQSVQQSPSHFQKILTLPLGSIVKMKDELDIAFPSLCNKKSIRTKIQQNLLQYISNKKKTNQATKNKELIWKTCLTKYLLKYDVLNRIQLYLELIKGDGLESFRLHKSYAKDMEFVAFLQSVLTAKKYFIKNSDRIVTPEKFQEYFCRVCLVYGCIIHESKFKTNQLCHHNFITHHENLQSSLECFSSIIQSKNQNDQIYQYYQLCSFQCYKAYENSLLQKCWHPELSFQEIKMINLSFSIFQFDPCKISHALILSYPILNCFTIYSYLHVSKYHLLFEFKMHQNEINLLQNEPIQYVCPKNQNQSNNLIKLCVNESILQQQFITCNQNCEKRGYCLAECSCDKICPLKLRCFCKKGQCNTKKCPCVLANQICQPTLCLNCFQCNSYLKINQCQNHWLYESQKRIKVAKSERNQNCFSIYALQNIGSNQQIIKFGGELISQEIKMIRSYFYEQNVLELDQNFSVDFSNFGNGLKFLEKAKGEEKHNVRLVKKNRKGQIIICLYSKMVIEKYETLKMSNFLYDFQDKIIKKI